MKRIMTSLCAQKVLKSAIKSNDRLHWNGYRFFRQEVKRELRFAEKAHVRSELLKCSGNTNGIWKIIINCLPRKKHPRPYVPDNPVALANKFNEYFTSVRGMCHCPEI